MTKDMQNSSEEISFAFDTFSLGMVLVAATDKGIAAILQGDSRDELRRELVYAFPKARLVADEAGLADKAAKIAAFLDAPNQGLDLPLDIRGSAQEQAVWQALRDVPAGHTITYGWRGTASGAANTNTSPTPCRP
jgi:AraC family transcriptional regulator of adaptative response/methylated-DNA-[protein]-cysteine methyltransferase